MSKYRRAARVDDNQKEIVDALEKLGVTVAVGHDDIFCGHKGKNYWFELKNPNTANKKGGYHKGRVKETQIKLKETWGGQYDIVHDLNQILEIMGIS